MDRLRSAAISVFLDHTLSAAVSCKGIMEQRTAHKATIQAVELWIKFCRNAQSLCGVLGLVAIDRAEEHLKYCLAYELSFGSPEMRRSGATAVLTYRSARCYVRALLAQHRFNYTAANLWSYAGEVYYHVSGAYLKKIECDPLRARNEEWIPWRKDLQSFKDKYCTPENLAHEELASLVEIVLQKYNTAAAYRCIYDLYTEFHEALPPDDVTFWSEQRQECYRFTIDDAALSASKDVVLALDYMQLALNSTSMTAEALQMLWRHCANLMLSAAQECKAGNERLTCYQSASPFVKRAAAFADTGHKVAKLVEAMNGSSAEPDSAVAQALGLQMEKLFEQVRDACLASEPLPTLAAINALVATLEVRLQTLLQTISPEQAAIARYAAEAARIDGSQSDAHKLLKDCWESAAEQMRLAVAASTGLRWRLHKHRSVLLEGLAVGPITAAIRYHVKAGYGLATTSFAQVWWRRAERALLTTAELTLRRFCECTEETKPEFERQCLANVEGSEIMAQLADCCERIETAKAADPALHQLYQAEYYLRSEMWEHKWGVVHLRERCLRDSDLLVDLCKSTLSRCVHPQLVTAALPLRRLRSLCTASSDAPSVRTVVGHSPAKEFAARVERLTCLCGALTAYLRYFRLKRVDGLGWIVLEDLLAPAVASAFDSIEAWRSKVGPYPPGHYIQCLQFIVEPLLRGDVESGLCWMAAARFLSTCSATSDLFDRSVQREVYNRLLQKAGAPQEAERLPLSEGQVEVASLEAESGRIERIMNALVSVEHCHRSQRWWLSGPDGYRTPKTCDSEYIVRAKQYSRAALYLRLSLALSLRAASATGAVSVVAFEPAPHAEEGDRSHAGYQYRDGGYHLWDMPPPGMTVASGGNKYTLTIAQRPIADLVAERYIQGCKCKDRERSELWSEAAELTEKALCDGTSEEDRTIALAEAEATAEELTGTARVAQVGQAAQAVDNRATMALYEDWSESDASETSAEVVEDGGAADDGDERNVAADTVHGADDGAQGDANSREESEDRDHDGTAVEGSGCIAESVDWEGQVDDATSANDARLQKKQRL